MIIPGYGVGTVQDTGGAIKDNRLDVWMSNEKDAFQWGRQNLPVYIECRGPCPSYLKKYETRLDARDLIGR